MGSRIRAFAKPFHHRIEAALRPDRVAWRARQRKTPMLYARAVCAVLASPPSVMAGLDPAIQVPD
jgi:hypothetical protein